MGRKPTGSLFTDTNDRRYVRLTIAGKRRAFPLPLSLSAVDAERRRVLLADLAARLRDVDVTIAEGLLERAAAAADAARLTAVTRAAERVIAGEVPAAVRATNAGTTWGAIAERWISGELARAYPDHVRPLRRTATVRSYLRRHLLPVIGGVPIASFTVDHALAAAAALPTSLRSTSRAVVLSVVSRVLALAVFPLRLISTSPIPRGFRPSGKRRARPFLYPAEDAKLLASPAVRLEWRFLYGVLAREGLRHDEARGLDVGDVDLEHGSVRLDVNKTEDPRAWALGPDVVRAFRAWLAHREAELGRPLRPDDPLVTNTTGRLYRPRADRFREHLLAAGVTRAELHVSTAERGPARIHDLRSTFVTLALASGRTETWVADRTGHRSTEMIGRYRRAARTAAELGLGWLSPLDEAIPELRGIGRDSGSSSAEHGKNAGDSSDRAFSSTKNATDHHPPESAGRRGAKAPVGAASPGPLPIPGPSPADSPRAHLAEELARRLGELAAAGDLAGARVAHRALGELLGGDGVVVDMKERRRR